jgi:hypothetical protein
MRYQEADQHNLLSTTKTFFSERSVHFRAQWVNLAVQLLRMRVREI